MRVWVMARIDSGVLDNKDELARCFPEIERIGQALAQDLMAVVGTGNVQVTGREMTLDDTDKLAKMVIRLIKGGEE